MNNNCIYLKQKLNRNLECKKQKKTINIKECNNCDLKEYKCTKISKNSANSTLKSSTLHNKSAKQTNCHTSKKNQTKNVKIGEIGKKQIFCFYR